MKQVRRACTTHRRTRTHRQNGVHAKRSVGDGIATLLCDDDAAGGVLVRELATRTAELKETGGRKQLASIRVHHGTVHAAGHDDERWPEGVHLGQNELAECVQVARVASAHVQRHVHVEPDSSASADLAGAPRFGVVQALVPGAVVHVQRHAQHVWPVVEDALRAVAVVRVKVDDGHAVARSSGAVGSHGAVVDVAVSVVAGARRVVPGRPNQAIGQPRGARENGVSCVQCRASGEADG